MEAARAIWDNVKRTAQEWHRAYQAGTRYYRMRVWIVSLLGADVAITVLGVLIAGALSLDVEVWFEPSFPSNLVVIRNPDGPIENATLILDGRYSMRVETIKSGVNGFEVTRDFRDESAAAPKDDYRPTQLELRVGGSPHHFAIGTAHNP